MMTTQRNDQNSGRSLSGPGRRVLANLGWLLVGVVVTVILIIDPLGLHPGDEWLRSLSGRADAPSSQEAAKHAERLWTCGMHPQVIQDHPGQCPICGMNLVPLDRGAPDVQPAASRDRAASPPSESSERVILYYRNPHDPSVISDVPTKDAMGMDYIPVYADQEDSAPGPVVSIDPAVVQNMNVVTAAVEVRRLSREIRTVGYLDYDQQKMVSVTTKYSGFIERVYVNYIGEPVKRGQPLFEIYSPELMQTQEEFLSARSFARRLEGAPDEARRRAEALVAAARTRLGYWDISEEQIRKLEANGRAVRTLTVTAPASGVVMMRMPGLEGMAVKPGLELFHIADLSTLWLAVEVFEDQLPWLREGSEAEVNLSYFPGEVFRGRVRFVEPQVNEKTRTVGLRLEVPNRDGRLRAGMYATVRFAPVIAEAAIAVPSLSLLRTGERNLVIVALGEGRFAPREVKIGAEGDRFVQILSGLGAGERIVTSAQFLIDSESNLREAIQKLLADRQNGRAVAGEAAEHVGH